MVFQFLSLLESRRACPVENELLGQGMHLIAKVSRLNPRYSPALQTVLQGMSSIIGGRGFVQSLVTQ